MNDNFSVAEEIFQQLGAGRMTAMIGVSRIRHGKDRIIVRFKARAIGGINKFEIILDPSDTYTVKLYRETVKGDSLKYETSDIYCDQLIDLLEKQTGLAFRMPQIYNATTGRRIA
jgi:hypothetical protein